MQDNPRRFTAKTFRRHLKYDEESLPRQGKGKLESSKYMGFLLVFLLGMATMFVLIHIYCQPTNTRNPSPDEVRSLRPNAYEGFPRVEEGRWLERPVPSTQPASSQPH